MIDTEGDLRRLLHEAAADQPARPDLLPAIERRAAADARRRTGARVLAGAAAVALVAGAAVALAGRGAEPRGTERAQAAPTTAPSGLGPGWHPLDSPLSDRMQHLALAMDDLVLVWGGTSLGAGSADLADGAVYDTRDGSWREVPEAPLASRGDAVGVWTGTEAVVVDADDSGGARAAAFDPSTWTWRELGAPPLDGVYSASSHAVWTGSEVIVTHAGQAAGELIDVDETGRETTQSTAEVPGQVAVLDPTTGRWRRGATTEPLPIFGDAAWTGSELVVVGDGGLGPDPRRTVRAYDPASDRWRDLPDGPDRLGAHDAAVAWTGDRLFVGGGSADGGGLRRDAALLDPVTGTWEAVPEAPVDFTGNGRYDTVWTGTEVLTLGTDGAAPLLFDPAARTWRQGPASPTPARAEVAWTWAGGRVVLAGGGVTTVEGEGVTSCCTPAPTFGALYVP